MEEGSLKVSATRSRNVYVPEREIEEIQELVLSLGNPLPSESSEDDLPSNSNQSLNDIVCISGFDAHHSGRRILLPPGLSVFEISMLNIFAPGQGSPKKTGAHGSFNSGFSDQ